MVGDYFKVMETIILFLNFIFLRITQHELLILGSPVSLSEK